jgi:hypothetical protein
MARRSRMKIVPIGDDEREVQHGRRHEDVEDSRDRAPMIAGDADGRAPLKECHSATA